MAEAALQRLVVVGAANAELAKLVRAINRADPKWHLVGYVDDDEGKWGGSLMGAPVLGAVGTLTQPELSDAAVAVSVGQPRVRRSIAELLTRARRRSATLVHPGVDTWGVTLDDGVLVLEAAVLSPRVRIGEHTIVSFGAFVGHDATVGSWCNLAPKALINGGCRVGDSAYIGAGAVLLPGVEVGDEATVAAGAVVTSDVRPGSTVFGNPARALRRGTGDPAFETAAVRSEAPENVP